jgi:putative cardiolipin synthase
LGVDGLLLRLELIARAQRSLDLQYYIFHGDESGKLITDALAHAAVRGVRVRILVDDAETFPGDEQLFALAGHENVSVRVFNPWRYRGHNRIRRGLEFVFNRERLDYRMHNKLFVADDSIALIGGRNIGDQYFQVDPKSQFADDDLFITGHAVTELGGSFQQFWDSEFAIPAQAFVPRKHRSHEAAHSLVHRRTIPEKAATAGAGYQEKLAAGEPLTSVLAGKLPLAWASSELACDSPDKKHVARGERAGRLTFGPVANAIRQTRSELTIVNPYLVPTPDELKLLHEERAQGIRVRILTTSLEATNDPLAQSGYMHYRLPLLKSGFEIFEVRARPESTRGTGQPMKLTRHGNYSLHAKLMAFDLGGVFVGSMNLDQRSRWLNTESGLVVHSPELAKQTVDRFTAMTQPQEAYAVTLGESGSHDPQLTWTTVVSGQTITTRKEPARSIWQRIEVRLLSLLPLDPEL